MVASGLSRIKQDIDLHRLVRNQNARLAIYFQVRTVLILTLDTAQYEKKNKESEESKMELSDVCAHRTRLITYNIIIISGFDNEDI